MSELEEPGSRELYAEELSTSALGRKSHRRQVQAGWRGWSAVWCYPWKPPSRNRTGQPSAVQLCSARDQL